MRPLLGIIFLMSLFLQGMCQADSTHVLKKGLYKSYTEYTANSPSITDKFVVYTAAQDKQDSTIKIYDYFLVDSVKTIGNVWGFCDGNSVYVKHSPGLQHQKFWKLEYNGKYPYFTFYNTNAGVVFTNVVMLVSSAVASTFDSHKSVEVLYIIMPDGDFNNATNMHFMRDFFKPSQGVLADYEAIKNKFNKPVLKGLIRRFSEGQ